MKTKPILGMRTADGLSPSSVGGQVSRWRIFLSRMVPFRLLRAVGLDAIYFFDVREKRPEDWWLSIWGYSNGGWRIMLGRDEVNLLLLARVPRAPSKREA